jgi:Xaa-Pro aminopeptidase
MADGHVIVWDYKRAGDMLTRHNPLVAETRGSSASLFYFAAGERTADTARAFAAEVAAEIRQRGGAGRRLAVDKIMVHGLRALEAEGLAVVEGEPLTERARAVKGPDEIRAMRCAIHACEAAMAGMEAIARPGLTEDEVWAELHAGNIRRGGEWIETRLLASGPRTNPWFQECGPRVIGEGEVLAFDTDLVGPYGICVDISRTWWIGDAPPPAEIRALMAVAAEHIRVNETLLVPGTPFRALTFGGHRLPEAYRPLRYSCRMHGVGLCDEWPLIAYPEDRVEGAFEDALAPGMVICVEAYVGAVGGPAGVKLEEQVLVTEAGPERLSRYPLDARLLA